MNNLEYLNKIVTVKIDGLWVASIQSTDLFIQ